MSFLSFTTTGQRWSATRGWFVPPIGRDSLSVSVMGDMSNGTALMLVRRILSRMNGGTPGAEVPIAVINAAYVASRGGTGCSDDFSGLNPIFEYDLVCSTFRIGDSVSGEIM